MCMLCGEGPSAAHAIRLSERPAHRLLGVEWSGTVEEARRGAIRSLLARAKRLSDETSATWRSPIVGLSWDESDDRMRYFAGIAADGTEGESDDLSVREFPEMRFASAWHGPGDGEVLAHYSRMLDWLSSEGLSWDRSLMQHREEYPPQVDVEAPHGVRLLLPITDEPDDAG